MYYLWKKQQTAKAEKRCWVDLRIFDQELFFKHFGKTTTKFWEILHMVAPSLTIESRFWDTISEVERLCVNSHTKHVVTGDSHTISSMNYRMGPTTAGRIIKETCCVIWDTWHGTPFILKLQNPKANGKKLKTILKSDGIFIII